MQGPTGVYVALFGVLYWILDSFEYTRDFTHIEFAARIGLTGLALYVSDDMDVGVLHWLSLISAGYYTWHFLRVAVIDRSPMFGWKYGCAVVLSAVAAAGYVPPGIMLMLALMEIPNIFRHATSFMVRKHSHWVDGWVYKGCDVGFFLTWMYYRVWVAMPVIVRFAFIDDVWQMRTPTAYVRTVQACVLVLVCVHVVFTWRLLVQAKNLVCSNGVDRYRRTLWKLATRSG